jgi:hypothetical protein
MIVLASAELVNFQIIEAKADSELPPGVWSVLPGAGFAVPGFAAAVREPSVVLGLASVGYYPEEPPQALRVVRVGQLVSRAARAGPLAAQEQERLVVQRAVWRARRAPHRALAFHAEAAARYVA